MTKTKIICTIGPAVNSLEKILDLIHSGMNVCRLNFSHGTHKEHKETIDLIKQARKQTNLPIAILLDTKGPEIRLGKVKKGGVSLSHGDRLWLVKDQVEGDEKRISIVPSYILNSLTKGTRVLIDNGYISSRVIDTDERGVLIEIENSGHVTSSKGVNIPKVSLSLPHLTENDLSDIQFGIEEDVDIIAASFVRSPEAIMTIKKILHDNSKSDILVYAKIENSEGIQNFDSILHVADGIMIARGDLGVEVPLSQVPRLQKMMIRKCYLMGKPSITATQMLESMIYNPRPTRAEVSDVANAIYDSTSAVMLSGETAIGKYPLETVQIMRSIITEAELDFEYHSFFDQHSKIHHHDVPSAVTLATIKTAYSLRAKAIFTFTHRGTTARLLSRLRPKMPIVALTSNEKTYNQLSINWGITPVLASSCETIDAAFKETSQFALNHHLVSYGDLVVLTAGAPFWVSGTTNTILVESIGDVMIRGHGGQGSKVHGNITLVPTNEGIEPYTVKNKVIVISSCNENYLPILRECLGVVLQNEIDDTESEKYAEFATKTLDKPLIIRADGAFRILREGQLVTLDPDKSLVYKGVVYDAP